MITNLSTFLWEVIKSNFKDNFATQIDHKSKSVFNSNLGTLLYLTELRAGHLISPRASYLDLFANEAQGSKKGTKLGTSLCKTFGKFRDRPRVPNYYVPYKKN